MAAPFRNCPRCGAAPASVYASSAYCRQCKRTYGRGPAKQGGDPMPATLYRSSGGRWLLCVHGLDPSTRALVAGDVQARALAASLLSQHLERSISPAQVQLHWHEAPADTLRRMHADPSLTVAALLDLARVVPSPSA